MKNLRRSNQLPKRLGQQLDGRSLGTPPGERPSIRVRPLPREHLHSVSFLCLLLLLPFLQPLALQTRGIMLQLFVPFSLLGPFSIQLRVSVPSERLCTLHSPQTSLWGFPGLGESPFGIYQASNCPRALPKRPSALMSTDTLTPQTGHRIKARGVPGLVISPAFTQPHPALVLQHRPPRELPQQVQCL